MGLHRPFKPPKSPTTVVDPAPPVFTKHEDLHKGHKPGQGQNQQQQQAGGNRKPVNRNQSYTPPADAKSNQRTSNGLSHKPPRAPSSTASTDLWIASANASVGSNRKTGRSTSGMSSSSDHSSAQSVSQQSSHQSDGSYYEEEILEDAEGGEDYYDEGMNGDVGPTSDELNLFPDRNPTIRFDEYDEMQTVLHINDYTKHEISRSWYKRSDYDKMVQLARKTAEKAEERKKELEQDEQEGLRRQLEDDAEEDEREEARQYAATTSTSIPQSSQRSQAHSVASVGSHNTRSSRGTSRGGGVSVVSEDSHQITEDDDEDFDQAGTSSRHSRRSNGSRREKSGRGGVSSSNSNDPRRTSRDGSGKEDGTGAGKTAEKKKPIEYRGLEAWTPSGAAKVKLLKESSIELVWNEQSNQWDNGIFDSDRIRSVYVAVSETALNAAYERGKNDSIIVQKLLEMDRLAAEKKKRRKLLGKTKGLVKKSVKLTGKGVQQTGKLMKKTTKVTKKVAKEATKRSLKAGVATATFDPRMMKEALKVSKKRECKHEFIRKPSQSHIQGSRDGSQRDENEMSASTLDAAESDPPAKHTTNAAPHSRPIEHADSSMTDATPPEAPRDGLTKKSSTKTKLKLLGVVPIPGTKKTWYKEDRRDKKAEKRIQKQKTRPSWEVNTADGKY